MCNNDNRGYDCEKDLMAIQNAFFLVGWNRRELDKLELAIKVRPETDERQAKLALINALKLMENIDAK